LGKELALETGPGGSSPEALMLRPWLRGSRCEGWWRGAGVEGFGFSSQEGVARRLTVVSRTGTDSGNPTV